ncbi:MAG: GspH/FimT family pseudopilin [Undibacterium sp.]|nr:GspH/FimT family pseudopilin [Undibacterium sp.]
MRHSRHPVFGFTLIELLVIISIVSILVSISIPSFGRMIISKRISSVTSQLHAALYLARFEALTRAKFVSICRSENADSALPSCAEASGNSASELGWGHGWIIYEDSDNDGKFTAQDKLLQVQGQLFSSSKQGAIHTNPNRKQLRFGPTGQTFGSYMRFTISRPLDNTDVKLNQFLCIASGGRVRVCQKG